MARREEQESPSGRVAAQVQALYRSASVLAARLATASGLHATDTRALELLDAAVDAPLTVGRLGAQLGLSSPAVTALVDRLERADLVARRRDREDRRRVVVELTPAARRFGAEHLRPVQERLGRAMAELSAGELETVERFLAMLLDEGAGRP